MCIGELAARIGTSPRSLRYYEDRGLLSAPRAANGHRTYDDADLRLVQEIRSLLMIGFGVEETRPFLECLRSGHPSGDACPDSRAMYQLYRGCERVAVSLGARPKGQLLAMLAPHLQLH